MINKGRTVKYANTFYAPASLWEWAQAYYDTLPKDINTLVSSGSSGCAIATAIILLAEQKGRTLYHFHISKGKNHNGGHAGTWPTLQDKNKREIICIVDDFISSGGTLNRIVKKLKEDWLLSNTADHEIPITVIMAHLNDEEQEQILADEHNLNILHANGQKSTFAKPPKNGKIKEKMLDKSGQ